MVSNGAPPAGGHSGNSPRVQLTLKRLKNPETNEAAAFDEDSPIAAKKAAQKLTNFRAYLHKSSVAGCFVDLLEIANDGGGELGGGGGGGGGGESGGGGGGRGGGGDGELAVAMGKDVTTLEVHRTQWVEVEGGGDGGGGGGGGGRDGGGGEAGRIQSPRELSVVGRETYEGASLSARHRSRGNARKGDPGAVRPSTTTALKPRATIAWGEVAVGPSTSVSTVARISTNERVARALRSRALIIEKEQRRAEENLTKNSDRKRAALEAAALVACQQGLLEVAMMVAKTRSLVARIDRLETMIEKQRKRDKAQRVLAARSMLRRRSIPGSDGASRGCKKLAQFDSAEDLRGSTVPSAKRLAIIRSALKNKFALHFQGAGRDERAGNRGVAGRSNGGGRGGFRPFSEAPKGPYLHR
eukprot:jgi/Undpi1/3781/HiC_scaffold_16.g07150.m1